MSMAENDYFSVRFVPQPISSVCFVPYSRYCLIVAYENTGMVVLFNLKVINSLAVVAVVVTILSFSNSFIDILICALDEIGHGQLANAERNTG